MIFCKFSRWREGVIRRIFGPNLDLSLKSKVELWNFWIFLDFQPVARRGNTSDFWSNFGPFLKIQSGTLDFLDFFVNSRVSPSQSRVSPLRWDRQHTLIPYVLGLGSPIPATQAAPPGIAIPIPIPSHSHPIITHTRDTQSFIPALRAGG